MSKKYVPSGYQIINLDLSAITTTGGTITPSTEDEKLLLDILSKSSIQETASNLKPILIHIKQLGGYDITAFATLSSGALCITATKYGLDVRIHTNDDINKLVVEFTEI